MRGIDGFHSMVIDYRKLNQRVIPITVSGPDVVFFMDWL